MQSSLVTSFKYLSLFGCLLAFLVVGLGAYTRLHDAGLGCPDWPGCYGHLVVPSEAKAVEHTPDTDFHAGKAWKEMIHRYLAGALGLLVLVLFILSLMGGERLGVRGLSGLLLVVILFQALLGMYTVTLKLHPLIVTGHLLGGFTTLGLLITLTLTVWKKKTICHTKLTDIRYNRGLVWLAFCLLIGQIFLGGWTSSNYAALACPDFPTCLSRWVLPVQLDVLFGIPLDPAINFEGGILSNESRASIHWLHRLGAVVVTLVLSFALWPLTKKTDTGYLHYIARLALLVLGIQVALGISNVLFLLPLAIALMHNINAAFLMSLMIVILYCGSNKKEPFS